MRPPERSPLAVRAILRPLTEQGGHDDLAARKYRQRRLVVARDADRHPARGKRPAREPARAGFSTVMRWSSSAAPPAVGPVPEDGCSHSRPRSRRLKPGAISLAAASGGSVAPPRWGGLQLQGAPRAVAAAARSDSGGVAGGPGGEARCRCRLPGSWRWQPSWCSRRRLPGARHGPGRAAAIAEGRATASRTVLQNIPSFFFNTVFVITELGESTSKNNMDLYLC